MKNKLKWFSAILLIVMMAFAQTGLAQNASSCDSAKVLTYPINTSVSSFTNSVYWFKVILNEGDFDIKIENLPGVGKIINSEVYTGSCSSLSLLSTDSIATPSDTTFHISIHNTSHAVTYYIKLYNSGGNVNFKKTMATTVQIVGQVGFCTGQQVTLTAVISNGGSNPIYAWSSGGGNGINAMFFPTSTTIYSLNYTDANGANITTNITVFPLGPNECKNCEYVQNGHFEWYNTFSNSMANILDAPFWSSATVGGSPEYFNSNFLIYNIDVPTNIFTNNTPAYSGNGYGGFAAFEGFTPNFREYVQNTLSCPLAVGQTYKINFYTILADKSGKETNKISAYLSNTPININTSSALTSITPQLTHPNTIPYSASNSWTQISGNINGNNQQYIIIGNFANDLNTNVSNSSSSTAAGFGAYYFVDNISVTPVPPTLSSSAVNCNGSTIVLTATGSPAAYTTWSDGTNTYAGAVVTVPTPNTTTTYYCTVNLPCSSCAPLVQSITVSAYTNPIVSISASLSNPCVGQSVTLTPSGAQTYLLQGAGLPLGGLTSSGAPFIVNPFTTTTYVLTGTSNGCTSTTQITIAPTGLGSSCINDHVGGTQITIPFGTNYTASGSYNNHNFTCLGNIIIPNNQTANFTNCTFMMGPNAQIKVGQKSTLNINRSHLYGCSSMWEGIYMNGQVGGNVTLTNTVLEDAHWGIWAPAAGTTGPQNFPNNIKVANCLFNTNYIDINYNNNITNTIDVSNTLFTSRCLSYDPPSVLLPTNVTNLPNVIVPIVQPAPFTMPLPYISGNITTNNPNPYVGLELTKFSSNNTPASGNQIHLTTRNIFDYHTIGIETLNFSNLKIEKQIFANGLGDAFNNKLFGYGSIGIYAHNDNWTVINNAYIGNVTIGGSAANTNSFVALDYGIYANGGGTADSRFTIRNNDFRQIRQNGITFYSYGSLVNNIPTRLIQNNTFTRVNAWGIYMLNSVTAYAIISVNDFVNPAAPTVYTPYGGIYIGEIKNPTTAKHMVTHNTMNRMVTGIKCENLAQLSANYNSIQLSPQVNGKQGFHLINCQKPVLTRNDITGNTTSSSISLDQGLYVLDCQSGSYTCNILKNTLIGSQFSGQNVSTTLFENTYDYNIAGVYLTNQGFIDIQDDPIYPGEPVDNKFLNYNTGQYHSYCATVGSLITNGVVSPFSIRTSPSMYDMTTNGNDLFSNPIQINTVASPLPQTNTFCNGSLNSPANRITNMANQIVNPGIYNATFIRDNNISRRQLYKVLENIAAPNSTLTAFKNSSVNNSIGQFAIIDSLTTEFSNTGNTSKLMQAQSLNSSVSSTTTVDGYQKQLNVLFVSYLTNNTLSTSELGQLQSIAALCPYTDGTSVWEARTFIKLFDSTEYVNICEQQTYPTALNNASRMAKPTVSETVDAQIKGQLIPNPNNGNFSIVMNDEIQDLKAEVYDVNGRLVCSNASANNNRIDILCSELTNGVYFVKVFINHTYNETHRLIITK